MKEPTYSVFVRFRRGQRLTLKRFAPLDVALRFAAQVRAERFHNPDDVFIIDDASGERVVEAASVPGVVVETFPEAPPTSEVHKTRLDEESDLEVLFKYVDRWQLRHAQLTLRGGQRLAAAVERSLGQLTRLMEQLARSKLFDDDLSQLLEQTGVAIEQIRKVRDGLHKLGTKLPELPARDDSVATGGKVRREPKPAQGARKRPDRGEG